MRTLTALSFASFFMMFSVVANAADRPGSPAHRITSNTGLQVSFVKNEGQTDRNVAFYTTLQGGTLFVTHTGTLVYSLSGGASHKFTSLTETPQSTRARSVQGRDPSQTTLNFFKGKDRSRWRSNVPTFDSLSLGEVAPKIELTLVSRPGTFEKVFRVRPGGDPGAIRMQLDGARGLKALPDGQLAVATSLGEVRFSKPVAYQTIDGSKRAVNIAYRVNHNGYSFVVGDYDRSRELVIDPILSTYLGGSGLEESGGLATYHTGATNQLYVYVAGTTSSLAGFPAAAAPGGVYGATGGGGGKHDAFVARVNYDLSYATITYLGGSSDVTDYQEEGIDVAVNPETGLVYVVGYTSGDFPMTGATDEGRGALRDAFVACLSNDLSTLIASRYLGGSQDDVGVAIAIENRSDEVPDLVYVTGWTKSTDFPLTTSAPQPSCGSCPSYSDGFAAVMDADLSLIRATYLGGCSIDDGRAIAVSPLTHDVYIGGKTSYNAPYYSDSGGKYIGCFPWIANQESFAGQEDAFIVRFGDRFQNATIHDAVYVGGSGIDAGAALAIDQSSGAVYMAGITTCDQAAPHTNNAKFPFPADSSYSPAYATCAGGTDAFVVRFDADLGTLSAATMFGGSYSDRASDVVLFGSSVYIMGMTESSNLPDTENAADPTLSHSELMLAILSPDLTDVEQATFLGGTWNETNLYHGLAIVNDPQNGAIQALVTGYTESNDLPGVPDTPDIVYQYQFAGSTDVFVTRLSASFTYAAGPQDIDVDPVLIDFGNRALNVSQAEVLQIQNVGGDPLTVSEMSLLTGTNFSILGSGTCGTLPFTLVSGSTCTVYLKYEPSATGRYEDILRIVSDDEDEPLVNVSLVGACEGDINVLPIKTGVGPMIDFPNTAVGTTFELSATIENVGPESLTITGVALATVEPTASGNFSIEFGGLLSECFQEFPVTLVNSSRFCNIKATFSPQSEGSQEAIAVVFSNDPDEPEVVVYLHGNGVAGTQAPVIHAQDYDFHDVAVGESRTHNIVISNTGGTGLQLREFVLSELSEFSVNPNTGAVPCAATNNVVAPSEYCTVGVTWSPKTANPDGVSETLTIVSNDPASPELAVTLVGRSALDSDGDGVLDIEEPGDENGDGTPDSAQASFAVLDSYDGTHRVMLEAQGGATFEEVRSDMTPNEVAGLDLEFPFGFFRFTLVLPAGATEGTIVMTVPSGHPITTYAKYGPEAGNSSFHVYDLGSYPGAVEINGNQITLHLVDNGRGDHDGALNGRIEDPGAPAIGDTVKDSGGCGCGTETGTSGISAWLLLALGFVILVQWKRKSYSHL